MKILRKQIDFITAADERGEKVIILNGGRRSGKTYSILQYIILQLCYSREPLHALIGTETYTRLTKTLFTDIQSICKEFPPGTGELKSMQLRFANGSTIAFTYAKADARGYSSRYRYIYINEAIKFPWGVVSDLLKAQGERCMIIVDYNPYSRFWLHDQGWMKADGSNVLTTTWRDNKMLPASAKRGMQEQAAKGAQAPEGSLERYYYEVECLGKDSAMYGKVYPNARTITDAQYAAIAVPEILGFDWGADFAEADPDVCIGVKIAGKEIYLREYYYSNSGSDEDIADAIISAKIPAGTRGVYDPATAGDIRARKIASHLISKAGLKLRLFPASKGSIMSGIRAMSDYTLCITQESKNIQYEQEHYAYGVDDAHGSIAPVDRDNHAMDALRYVFDAWALSGGRL